MSSLRDYVEAQKAASAPTPAVDTGVLTPAQQAAAAAQAKAEAEAKAAEEAKNPYGPTGKLTGDEKNYPNQTMPNGTMGAKQYEDYLNRQLANPQSSINTGLADMQARVQQARQNAYQRPNETTDEFVARKASGYGLYKDQMIQPDQMPMPNLNEWDRGGDDTGLSDSEFYLKNATARTGVFSTQIYNDLRKKEEYSALQAKSLAQSKELGAYPDRATAEHAKRLAELRANRPSTSSTPPNAPTGTDAFMSHADAFDYLSLGDGEFTPSWETPPAPSRPWEGPPSPLRRNAPSPRADTMPWRGFDIQRPFDAGARGDTGSSGMEGPASSATPSPTPEEGNLSDILRRGQIYNPDDYDWDAPYRDEMTTPWDIYDTGHAAFNWAMSGDEIKRGLSAVGDPNVGVKGLLRGEGNVSGAAGARGAKAAKNASFGKMTGANKAFLLGGLLSGASDISQELTGYAFDPMGGAMQGAINTGIGAYKNGAEGALNAYDEAIDQNFGYQEGMKGRRAAALSNLAGGGSKPNAWHRAMGAIQAGANSLTAGGSDVVAGTIGDMFDKDYSRKAGINRDPFGAGKAAYNATGWVLDKVDRIFNDPKNLKKY
jgi:hypothetical protein